MEAEMISSLYKIVILGVAVTLGIFLVSPAVVSAADDPLILLLKGGPPRKLKYSRTARTLRFQFAGRLAMSANPNF
jgi:hypothetical protein